jgi:hypothetical protein
MAHPTPAADLKATYEAANAGDLAAVRRLATSGRLHFGEAAYHATLAGHPDVLEYLTGLGAAARDRLRGSSRSAFRLAVAAEQLGPRPLR